MNRAIHQIDPVILRVNSGNEALLQMHGSALVEACNDHTYNHYSLHGNWVNDDFAMRKMIVPDLAGIPAVGATSHGRFAIGNGIFENGPLISRNEWVEWQGQLVAATKEPSRSPRKMAWKPSLSNLKIESMESQPLPLNQLVTYSFLPLEVLNNMIQTAGVAPKKTVHAPVSSPIGIMETVTRKAWSSHKSAPPLTIRPGIMGDLIKKAWASPHDSLRNLLNVVRMAIVYDQPIYHSSILGSDTEKFAGQEDGTTVAAPSSYLSTMIQPTPSPNWDRDDSHGHAPG
ncbi:unnamed protein product [Penicillium viridicatum]